jgi:hypothetical protein
MNYGYCNWSSDTGYFLLKFPHRRFLIYFPADRPRPWNITVLSQIKNVAKNVSHVYLELTVRGPMKIIFCPMLSISKKDIGLGRIPGFVCSSDKSDI